jgi:hypothetical protein
VKVVGVIKRLSGILRILCLKNIAFGCACLAGSMVSSNAEARPADVDRHATVDFSLLEAYDSDVLRAPENLPAPANVSKSDFRITPSVQLDVRLPVGRQSVFVKSAIGYDFYHNNRQLNRERISVDGGVDLSAASCNSHITASAGRRQSDLGDVFGLTRTKNAETRLGYGVNLSCGGIIGLRPTLGYEYQDVQNDDILRSRGNFRSRTYSASIAYVRPTFGEFSIYGSYRRGSYPGRLVFGSFQPERIKVYSAGLRFSRDIGSRIKGTISAGYTIVDPNLAGVARFKGASWSADVNWRVTDRLQTNFLFARSAEQSNLLDVSYSINDNYQFNATYGLTPTVQLSMGASYLTRNFRNTPLIPGSEFRGADRLAQVRGGVRFHPAGRFSYSFDVTGANRRSDTGRLDYRNVFAGLTIRFGY